jgi:hypothetical protein
MSTHARLIWRLATSNMKTQQIELLTRILQESEKVGGIRALVIAFLMPEFARILGHLSELADIIEGQP